MMRLGIIAGKATSLINVAKDIAYVAQRKGHVPRILTYVESPTMLAKSGDGFILVYPAVPLFCAEYMLLFRELRVNHGKPAVYYAMIEGRPRKHHIAPWMRRDVEFVAVSKYVREKLVEAGFRVLGVVPHGIVREVVAEAQKMVSTARKHLERLHGEKVIFGVVSHTHPRKGIDYLVSAIQKLSEKRDDFVVHLVTNREALKRYSGVKNLYVDAVFGTRSREEILAFLGAVDFLVVPALAEGFCLPLLEANAMGTLVIHALYPPLTEISDADANIVFEYDDVRITYVGDGVEYECHVYSPETLAEAMERAIDLLSHKDELEDRKEKVKAVLERYDAEKLYPKLLRLLGV